MILQCFFIAFPHLSTPKKEGKSCKKEWLDSVARQFIKDYTFHGHGAHGLKLSASGVITKTTELRSKVIIETSHIINIKIG